MFKIYTICDNMLRSWPCLSSLYYFFGAAIDVDTSDIKALYRRCQALEKLGKLDMAFKDVQRCATLEPKNKTFLETLRRLGAEIQQKVRPPYLL